MTAERPRRRLSWQQVPDHIRRAVERSLGAAVVEARTQEGGYSPGAAVRVRLGNGGKAFVKALSNTIHRNSAQTYRSEAANMARLPPGLPVPRLLDVHDDGNWIALVYEEVDGRPPVVPWRAAELESVAATLQDMSAALTPSPWPDAPRFELVDGTCKGWWHQLAAASPTDLDPWTREHLDWLVAREADLPGMSGGDTMLHVDIRSDNLLITPDGRVVILDWSYLCNGAAWLDLLMFAVTANAEGGADVDELIRRCPLTRDLDAACILAALVGCAGYYVTAARRPEPPKMRGLRAHHVAHADATLQWVRRRVAVGG
jgi:aminoglycoside phosphotransferase (APT) family kinase protein